MEWDLGPHPVALLGAKSLGSGVVGGVLARRT
jgi:hypothetical protein